MKKNMKPQKAIMSHNARYVIYYHHNKKYLTRKRRLTFDYLSAAHFTNYFDACSFAFVDVLKGIASVVVEEVSK